MVDHPTFLVHLDFGFSVEEEALGFPKECSINCGFQSSTKRLWKGSGTFAKQGPDAVEDSYGEARHPMSLGEMDSAEERLIGHCNQPELLED